MISTLTLELAEVIIDGALRKANELNAAPLTIAVLDQGGHLKAFRRQDATSVMRPDIAIAKAWGAIGLGMSSRELGNLCSERPAFFASMSTLAGGNLVPVPGGVLICHNQQILGAVGITGDKSDVDESCALAGIEAASLSSV